MSSAAVPPAATVVLIREAAGGAPALEVFLLRRAARGAFGGAHVFPGGRVDARDHDLGWRPLCDGLDELERRIGPWADSDDVGAHAVAAIREVFEEAGLLLARGLPTRPDMEAARQGLLTSEWPFLDWCRQHHVRLALDQLVPWAHWITPTVEPKRFDTWFFLSRVDSDTTPSVSEGEVVSGRWFRIEAALEANERREIVLPPPTLRTLEELSRHTTWNAIVDAATRRPLAPVCPRHLASADLFTLVLPGDPEYGETDVPPVNGPTRFVRDGERWSSVVANRAR